MNEHLNKDSVTLAFDRIIKVMDKAKPEIKRQGGKAFRDGNFKKAEVLSVRARFLSDFRSRVDALRKEWIDGDKPRKSSVQQSESSRKPTNPMSLREAALKVTAEKPLTKPEIMEAVKKLGYKFNTKKPMDSLGTLLYKKKDGRNLFKNENGRFSPGQST